MLSLKEKKLYYSVTLYNLFKIRQIIIVIISRGGDSLHDFIKKITVLCTVFCIIIYSAIILGEKKIPDNITVIENESFDIFHTLGTGLYSLSYENQYDGVLRASNSSQKTTKIKFCA